MSYCRFSSDNFECDLYVYDDVHGGITFHVAEKRLAKPVTPLPDFVEAGLDRYLEAHNRQMADLEKAERVPIGLPYDGKTFNVDTYEEALEVALTMRHMGYRFPDSVIEAFCENARIEEHESQS